ncbi:MAG TPA: hypothetical protein VG872_02895 [Acidimicrobiia bacterium]|jgi:hypothetical protein|nr:hypothetical protein [Acidimicrobiia bacterium]
MTGVYAVVIALAVLVALLAILVIGLLRSHADILRRLESVGAGLGGGHDHGSQITLTRRATGTVAERRVTGVTPDGEPVALSLGSGTDPTLVAFLSTTCSTCTPFWEGLQSSLMHFGGHRHRVVVVTLGESEESPTRAQSLAKPGVDVVMSSSAWSEFEVPGAPYFVLIEPGTHQVIGEGSAMTFESLEEFLSDATNDQTWDLQTAGLRDEESRIDAELRAAGILPGDPRLYHQKGDISEDGS